MDIVSFFKKIDSFIADADRMHCEKLLDYRFELEYITTNPVKQKFGIIGEYTGFSDYNGNKIHVGDVVEYIRKGKTYKGLVVKSSLFIDDSYRQEYNIYNSNAELNRISGIAISHLNWEDGTTYDSIIARLIKN